MLTAYSNSGDFFIEKDYLKQVGQEIHYLAESRENPDLAEQIYPHACRALPVRNNLWLLRAISFKRFAFTGEARNFHKVKSSNEMNRIKPNEESPCLSCLTRKSIPSFID